MKTDITNVDDDDIVDEEDRLKGMQLLEEMKESLVFDWKVKPTFVPAGTYASQYRPLDNSKNLSK